MPGAAITGDDAGVGVPFAEPPQYRLSPQQYSSALVVTPQTWFAPAEMDDHACPPSTATGRVLHGKAVVELDVVQFSSASAPAPSWPCVLAPQQYATFDATAMPHVTVAPTVISRKCSPTTSVGARRSVVVPSPSPAQPLEPQQYATS